VLSQLIQRMCEARPRILLLDDLQWADLRSLEFLSFFLRDALDPQGLHPPGFKGCLVLGLYRRTKPTPVCRICPACGWSWIVWNRRRRAHGAVHAGGHELPDGLLELLCGRPRGMLSLSGSS